MPAISVIIPVYKVERYLDACVASVAGQTFADLEILLVDDGSPDACPALCDAWAQRDPRIRVIHRQNGGLSAARNTGIEAAAGRFLAFVDADDLLEPDTLRRAYEAQAVTGADLVIFNLRYVDETNTPLPAPDFSQFRDEVLTPDEVWQRYFSLAEQRIYYVVAWNKLYRRCVIRDVRYPVGRLHEDEFTTYRFDWNAEKLVFVDVSKYNYDCTRENSITTQAFRENHLDACFAMRERVDFLQQHGVDCLRKKAVDCYCWVLFDRLYKAYRAGLSGPKLQQVLEMVDRDAREFGASDISPANLQTLRLISQAGLKEFGKMREQQEAR